MVQHGVGGRNNVTRILMDSMSFYGKPFQVGAFHWKYTILVIKILLI